MPHELRDAVRPGAGGGLRGKVQEDVLHQVRAEGVLGERSGVHNQLRN